MIPENGMAVSAQPRLSCRFSLIAPERMSLLCTCRLYQKHLAENNQKTQRYDIALWKR